MEEAEADGPPTRVGASRPEVGVPSSVGAFAAAGGVSAATIFPELLPSGARQFVHVTAPAELGVLQCGQSIAGILIYAVKLQRLCVSQREIKVC